MSGLGISITREAFLKRMKGPWYLEFEIECSGLEPIIEPVGRVGYLSGWEGEFAFYNKRDLCRESERLHSYLEFERERVVDWVADSLGLVMAMEHVFLGPCPTLDRMRLRRV